LPSCTGNCSRTFAHAAAWAFARGGAEGVSGGSGPVGAGEPERPVPVSAAIANATMTTSGSVTAVAMSAARR
jgi:hypothetical protein